MADADALRPAGVPGRNPEGPSDASPPPPLTPPPIVTTGDEQAVMSLVDHLTELRSRIFRAVLAVVVFGVVGFWFGDPIIAWLAAPIPIDGPLFFTGIGDPFVIRTKIALVVGVILAMPVILYQLWAFIAPGLTPSERRALRPWIPLALFFFVLGVTIAYVILPFVIGFLLGFTNELMVVDVAVAVYFDFVTTM